MRDVGGVKWGAQKSPARKCIKGPHHDKGEEAHNEPLDRVSTKEKGADAESEPKYYKMQWLPPKGELASCGTANGQWPKPRDPKPTDDTFADLFHDLGSTSRDGWYAASFTETGGLEGGSRGVGGARRGGGEGLLSGSSFPSREGGRELDHSVGGS